ncbi:DUF2058 domain-containing protein [Hydrogenovibrio sp. 3SP14C1]|uniref:DUF2058 domain-containing protein n=1 Tax=Hydrogenovibrio sp. 3SP14C1 TaxID=3038774 RepID=UPI00241614FA|nr:DUF2058 domain-containing protein [Hydrogenovibrio sp. 3SP14C1]MDG4812535.1 DUF2058 domain-containing protein [Hydrogenovibrio sp. 3SP14C1]
MAGSLFDQLKKSGLVDEKKAKKVKREKYQQSKQNKSKKGQTTQTEATKLAAEAAQQKSERDRQLNQERQQQQAQKAAKAELYQLIDSNRLKNVDGDIAYNFVDGTAVKTLNVNADTHKRLVADKIRIAKFKGGYALLPETIIEKVAQRDSSVLIPLAQKDDTLSKEDEEYYAQFEVPDDLIW